MWNLHAASKSLLLQLVIQVDIFDFLERDFLSAGEKGADLFLRCRAHLKSRPDQIADLGGKDSFVWSRQSHGWDCLPTGRSDRRETKWCATHFWVMEMHVFKACIQNYVPLRRLARFFIYFHVLWGMRWRWSFPPTWPLAGGGGAYPNPHPLWVETVCLVGVRFNYAISPSRWLITTLSISNSDLGIDSSTMLVPSSNNPPKTILLPLYFLPKQPPSHPPSDILHPPVFRVHDNMDPLHRVAEVLIVVGHPDDECRPFEVLM